MEKITDDRGDLVCLIDSTQPFKRLLYLTINPGFTRGNHYHKENSERFLLLEGSVRIKLEYNNSEKIFEMQIGQIYKIEVGVRHSFENFSDWQVAKILVFSIGSFQEFGKDTFK